MSAIAVSSLGDTFLVKEHVGFFKAASNYDVFDPRTGQQILACREPNLGLLTKLFRFTDYKRMTPFDLEVRTPSGDLLMRVTRGVSIVLSKVAVTDGAGATLGGFEQKFFSIGGAFDVKDASGQNACSLKGKWTGWDFRFERQGQELARVSKKWAGLGKELLTSADNYVLEILPSVPANDPVRALILAAVFCIDLVLKE
jgi:uncharacterized protein YxjI